MIASYKDFEDRAADALVRMGLPAPERPGDYLHIVDGSGVVSKWPGDQLGHIQWEAVSAWLGVLAAWKAYALAQEGIADAVAATAKAELKRLVAPLLLSTEGRTITEKRAQIDALPEVAALMQIQEQASIRKELIKSVADGFDLKYQAVSRDLSRRGLQAQVAGPLGDHHQKRAARGI